MATDIPRAVELGCSWLDRKFGPDWHARIHLDDLEMGSSDRCVLAQLMGWQYDVIRDSFMVWEHHSKAEADQILQAWGFDLPWGERHRVDELTAEWVLVIGARWAAVTR